MLGTGEIIVVVAIGVLVFGAKKFPQLGQSMGKAVRNFKNSLQGKDDSRKIRDVKPLDPADDSKD